MTMHVQVIFVETLRCSQREAVLLVAPTAAKIKGRECGYHNFGAYDIYLQKIWEF